MGERQGAKEFWKFDSAHPHNGGERQGGWGERNTNVTSKFQRKLMKTMFLRQIILPQAEI